MRVVKLAILSFIFLFLLVTIISLFIPAHIRISKATNIYADDQDSIEFYTGYLPKWREWHPALKNTMENELQVLNDSSISIRGTRVKITERKIDELVTEIKTDNG